MRWAVVGLLVVSVLACGLVGRQGLRAGCVDSASHEHLLEVHLSVPQRAEESGPRVILRQSLSTVLSGPALSCPAANQLLCGKATGSAHRCLNPSFLLNLSPANLILILCLSAGPPPSAEQRG